MKRYGNLYPQIVEFDNIYLAARKAQKGKRFRDNVLEFNYNLGTELLKIQQELRDKTYQPGSYRTFHLRDIKSRLISAAPYRDRVVHHALCNIIIPIFERTFISDTYANREGYGTHKALRRFTAFARSSRYVLQCDIKKYFPSIDHEILKQLIRRKIKCKDTLWLIDKIIDNSNEQEEVINYFPGDDLLTPIQRRHSLPKIIKVRNNNLHRARKRLKKLQKDYALGKIDLQDIKQSLSSWEAHLKHGDTWRLRQQIFSNLVFTRH